MELTGAFIAGMFTFWLINLHTLRTSRILMQRALSISEVLRDLSLQDTYRSRVMSDEQEALIEQRRLHAGTGTPPGQETD